MDDFLKYFKTSAGIGLGIALAVIIFICTCCLLWQIPNLIDYYYWQAVQEALKTPTP